MIAASKGTRVLACSLYSSWMIVIVIRRTIAAALWPIFTLPLLDKVQVLVP
jgi:hypothetical protein